MSEEQSDGGVRRFGRKDRKRSLDPRGPLFPPEDFAPDQAEQAETQSADSSDDLPEVAEDIDEAVENPEFAPVLSAPIQSPPRTAVGKRGPVQPRERHVVANLLTIVFLLATVATGGLIALIATNPNTPLNPFPPFTPLPIVITATFLPPTPTPEGTAVPTATFTPVAVETDANVQTSFAFKLASEQPIYIPNANEKGCNWSSIAGTVTDSKGSALDGYRVHISGNGIDETVFSGAALTFGTGGFELFLNGVAQEQSYSVQLLDPQRTPLSALYNVSTRAGCDQNVAVLQFIGS